MVVNCPCRSCFLDFLFVYLCVRLFTVQLCVSPVTLWEDEVKGDGELLLENYDREY